MWHGTSHLTSLLQALKEASTFGSLTWGISDAYQQKNGVGVQPAIFGCPSQGSWISLQLLDARLNSPHPETLPTCAYHSSTEREVQRKSNRMVITLATKSVCIHSGNPLRGPHYLVRHRNTLVRGQLVHDAKELVLPLGLYTFAHKKCHIRNGLKGHSGLCLLGKMFLQSLSPGTISPWSRPAHRSPSHAEHTQMCAVPEDRAHGKAPRGTSDKTCRPQPPCAPHPREIGTRFPNAATQLHWPYPSTRPCHQTVLISLLSLHVPSWSWHTEGEPRFPRNGAPAFRQEGIHACCLQWVLRTPNSHSSRAQKQASTHQRERATGGSLLFCWAASQEGYAESCMAQQLSWTRGPSRRRSAQSGSPRGGGRAPARPAPRRPPAAAAAPCSLGCGVRERRLREAVHGASPAARPGPAPSPPAASGRASRRSQQPPAPRGPEVEERSTSQRRWLALVALLHYCYPAANLHGALLSTKGTTGVSKGSDRARSNSNVCPGLSQARSFSSQDCVAAKQT